MHSDDKKTDRLDDEWFYRELSELKLEDTLDLSNWYGRDIGPRWRGIRESVWIWSSMGTGWRRLLRRVPHYFASEIVYLNSRILDISRRIHPQFDTILADHAYHEWLLYSEFDYEQYRDHIVHPFKTAAIANWLLRETNKISTVKHNLMHADHVQRLLRHWGLHQDVLDEHGTKIILAALWLGSVLHDLGYGHYFACQLNKRLARSYHFSSVDLVGQSVSGVKSQLIERSLILRHLLDERSWREFKGSQIAAGPVKPETTEKWRVTLFENLGANHSIAGGLNLLCLLQEVIDFWPSVDPRLAVVFELAAEAIFLHDLTSESKFRSPNSALNRDRTDGTNAATDQRGRIDFRETPLAVILVLADELQCWGRPRLVFRQGDRADETVVRYDAPAQALRYRRVDSNGSMIILELETEIWEKLEGLATNPGDGIACVNWEDFVLIRPFEDPPRPA